MFTLPVSVDQHLWSKLIVSAIWFAATALTCMLAVMLMLLCNINNFEIDWSEVGYVMGELGRKMKEFGVLHIVGYCLELLAIFFVGSCVSCLTFYCAMAIGYSFSNRKVLLWDADYIQKARTWIECSNEMGGTEPFNEFRRVIEVGIVGLACERATEEDMAALDVAVTHLDEDPSNYMYDVEFHDALAVASHNSMLASTIHLVNNLIADVRIRFWDLPSYHEQTQQSHHAIYEAVKDRDAARAQREMIRHLNIVSQFAQNYPARDRGDEEAPVPEQT